MAMNLRLRHIAVRVRALTADARKAAGRKVETASGKVCVPNPPGAVYFGGGYSMRSSRHSVFTCFLPLLYAVSLSVGAVPCHAQTGMRQSHHIISGDAQTLPVNVAHLQEQNKDLPGGNCICETSDHTMWLGTEDDGLISWDGTHFLHYRHREDDTASLPDNHIVSVTEEDPHHLWVATRQSLALLDRTTQKFRLFTTTDGESLPYPWIVKSPDGAIYCGTSNGFYTIDKARAIARLFGNPQIVLSSTGARINVVVGGINHLHIDRRGILWAILLSKNYAGLVSFDFKARNWILHVPEDINLKQPCFDPKFTHVWLPFWTLCPDPDGDRLWLGGWSSGLWRYSISSRSFGHAAIEKKGEQVQWVNTISAMLPKNDSELYLGTYHCIETVNTRRWTATNYMHGSEESGTGALARDHAGNTWFVSNRIPFGRIHPLNNRFAPAEKLAIPHVNISAAFVAPDGRLWVNNFKQIAGINKNVTYEYAGGKLRHVYSYPDDKPDRSLGPIRHFYRTASGALYAFGGYDHAYNADTVAKCFRIAHIRYTGLPEQYNGLADYKAGYQCVVPWSDSIFFALQTTTDDQGVARINMHSRTAIQYKPTPARKAGEPAVAHMYYAIRDSFSRLVIAQEQGLSLFYPAEERFVNFTHSAQDAASLPTNFIRRICQTPDSFFYLAAENGLIRADLRPGRKPAFRIVVPDLKCDAMFAPRHRNELWVATDAGQLVLDTRTFAYRIYSAKDGYPWGRRYPLTDSTWLTEDGSFINPARIPQNSFLPKPLPAGLSVFDKPYVSDTFSALKKEFRLRHDENFFSIAYSCDAYIGEAQNRYAYKLDGFDTGWVQAGERTTAYYTGIAPGRYRFWVKAANSDGLWGAPMMLHTINIIPAWYQTWWLKTLAVLSALALLLLLFRLRLNAVKARAREQQIAAELAQTRALFEQQIAETEMAALRAQMNPHFIFNVLNSINKFILTSDPDAASDYLNSFSRLIRLVLENSKSMKVPLATDMEALRLYIDMERLRFSNKFDYEISIPQDIDQQYVQIPPLLIQPYVENAIWHGLMQKEACEKKLSVTVTQPAEDVLQIEVIDNGIGRARAAELRSKSATRHKSFGLQITKDRIAIVNKLYNIRTTVEIRDQPDNATGEPGGTRVLIIIPV